jgi:hypothetical protein
MVDLFWKNYTRWGLGTRKSFGHMVGRLKTVFGDIPLNGLNRRQIEGWLRQRVDGGEITASSANRYLAILGPIFTMAMDYGYIMDSHMVQKPCPDTLPVQTKPRHGRPSLNRPAASSEVRHPAPLRTEGWNSSSTSGLRIASFRSGLESIRLGAGSLWLVQSTASVARFILA